MIGNALFSQGLGYDIICMVVVPCMCNFKWSIILKPWMMGIRRFQCLHQIRLPCTCNLESGQAWATHGSGQFRVLPTCTLIIYYMYPVTVLMYYH